PGVDALQALRGVQGTVAVTTVAALGALPRFDHPRPLLHSLGVTPAAYSTGERRRQGGLTTTGPPPAPFCSRLLRVVIMPIWFPSCMPLSLLPPEASRGLGQRQHRQGCGLLLRHWHRWPGFRDEAAQRQRCVVEQRHQDQVPAAAKDTDQSQAGGP